MIILHNPHDKISREFVENYGQNCQILEYPECLNTFPNISAFPSVVLDIPDHIVDKQIIDPPLDEAGNPITDIDGNPIQPIEIEEHIVEAYQEIFRTKEPEYISSESFWNEIQIRLDEISALNKIE